MCMFKIKFTNDPPSDHRRPTLFMLHHDREYPGISGKSNHNEANYQEKAQCILKKAIRVAMTAYAYRLSKPE